VRLFLGVVRFDRTQPIGSDFVKPAEDRLMDDCQEVFDDWLGTYLFSASVEIHLYTNIGSCCASRIWT
jgi:hypothetical protein